MERHRDNIGLLRLVLASLVIVGHAPEMVDGDRHREPIALFFHTLSFGEIAVDGFFLISGYLITMSWLRTNSLRHYLQRRVLRIYPAFILAYLLSTFALGPLVGAQPWRDLPQTLIRLAFLEPPPDFPGQLLEVAHYRILNGALWTIAFEFRCYVLVALLGISGLLQHRKIMAVLTLLGLVLTVASTFHAVDAPASRIIRSHQVAAYLFTHPGQPLAFVRLTTAFLVGACTYLYRAESLPRLTSSVATVCTATTALLMFHDPHLAEAALITLGASALFWLGFKARLGPLQRVNDRWDISYGVYLYGWPIATALRWYDHGITPVALAALSLPLAMVAGAASWWGIERWTKDLARFC